MKRKPADQITAKEFNDYFKRKPKVKPKSEHDIQSEFIAAFRSKYPRFENILFAIPNGGKRHITTAMKLKREGALSGVPDVFFAYPNFPYPGLFLEFKAGKNKTTPKQDTVINDLRKFGYVVEICYTCEDAMNCIDNYLNLSE